MNQVLEWLKSNVVTVVLAVVMLAAVIALPIVGGRLNEGVRKDMDARLKSLQTLDSLAATNVDLTFRDASGATTQVSAKTAVNQAIIDRVKEVTSARRADAEAIFAAAEAHNRREHALLMPVAFTTDPRSLDFNTMPRRFHEALLAAYDELLERVGGGEPPDSDALVADLERRRRQFLTGTLQKEVGAALEDAEAEQLREHLAKSRAGLCARRAEDVLFYVDRTGLAIPGWNQSQAYDQLDLFGWQWNLWVTDEVLSALSEANRASGNVLRGPVKRVLSLEIADPFVGSVASGGGGGDDMAGGMGMGGGDMGMGGGEEAAPVSAGGPPNPDAEVARDFGLSLTGRASNSLYDVVDVRVTMDVETAGIPQALDALSRRNFITVLDLDMTPADPFEALRAGYVYGNQPTSRLVVHLETIWLRTWTVPLMPEVVRQQIGAALPAAPTEGEG